MLEILKTLLLDFLEMVLITGIPRQVEIESVPGKAIVCEGGEYCRKSTFMFQVMQRLMERDVMTGKYSLYDAPKPFTFHKRQ